MESYITCRRCKKALPLESYYTCHDNTKYYICKDCLIWTIDDNNPDTYLYLLEDMNYPYIKEEWNCLIKMNNERSNKCRTIFGKYISKMRLKGFKKFTWKDNEELDNRYNRVSSERKVNMNPFAQTIGIYYTDEDWADYMFKTIVEESGDAIEKSACGKNNTFINFKDGSYIKFLPIDKEAYSCGQRFTKAYVQNKNLDENRNFIFQVIYPSLTLGQEPKCYIINSYEDLWKSCTEVRDFYWKMDMIKVDKETCYDNN